MRNKVPKIAITAAATALLISCGSAQVGEKQEVFSAEPGASREIVTTTLPQLPTEHFDSEPGVFSELVVETMQRLKKFASQDRPVFPSQ